VTNQTPVDRVTEAIKDCPDCVLRDDEYEKCGRHAKMLDDAREQMFGDDVL